MRTLLQTSFLGSPYVGVFAHVTNDYLVVRPNLDQELVDAIASELSVSVIETTVGGSTTVGSLVAGNDNGLLVSNRISSEEQSTLQDAVSVPVQQLPSRITAVGNVILANNSGAYVHPDLTNETVETIADTLDVTVEQGMIADVRTVGMAAVATDSGVLCHPKATDSELERLSNLLDVYADVGTINYGGPLVGSGLLANNTGYVAGEETTGPELGRIEDALGYID